MSCRAELPGFCLAVLLAAFQPLAAQTTTPRDGEPVSTLSAGSRSPVAFLPAPFHPGDTAFRADTERVGHHGSKSLHESIGMVIGAALFGVVGLVIGAHLPHD